MSLPKISVITISNNHGRYIEQNIESVLSQNYGEVEHIIIDQASTDNTVGILKSYEHLKWTCESVKSRAQALNLGFSKATGEIITWLDGDCWFPQKIFHEIATCLKDKPVVIGMCADADETGKQLRVITNPERTWFDILKYWIDESLITQSFFVKKDFLEEIVRSEGKYFNESLKENTAWFDLLLRLAKVCDFDKRIPAILSFRRIYDQEVSQRSYSSDEYSEVFNREAGMVSGVEKKISLVVPFYPGSGGLDDTLNSIGSQTLQDFELFIVDCSDSEEDISLEKRTVYNFTKQYPAISCQKLKADHSAKISCLNIVLEKSAAPLLIFVSPGWTLHEDYCLTAVNLFSEDCLGFAFPFGESPELSSELILNDEDLPRFNIQTVFREICFPPVFAARTTALLEISGERFAHFRQLSIRDLLLRLFFKGWKISPENILKVAGPNTSDTLDPETVKTYINYIRAQLVCDIYDAFETDPMSDTRIKLIGEIVFPGDLVRNATRLLRDAPETWFDLEYEKYPEKLEVLSRLFPTFSPFVSLLYKESLSRGDEKESEELYAKFKRLEKRDSFGEGYFSK